MQKIYPIAFVAYLLSCSPQFLLSQCPEVVNAGQDVYLCAPTSPIQLHGSINGDMPFGFTWKSLSGGAVENVLDPIVQVDQTTTFELSTSTTSNTNLIYNGDFELGNTGFWNYFTYSPGNLNTPGLYDVLSNPQSANPNYAACADHTSGAGKMLAASGSMSTYASMWCQQIQVTPYTNYHFSFWYANAAMSLGGVSFVFYTPPADPVAYPPVVLPAKPCDWANYSLYWNSGPNYFLTICIFAHPGPNPGTLIDDISFSPLCVDRDSVTVFVTDTKAKIGPSPVTVPCGGSNITLSGVGSSSGPNVTYSWETTDGNIVSGSNSINPVVNAAGTYTLTVKYEDAHVICTDTASIEITELVDYIQTWITPANSLDCTHPTTVLTSFSSNSPPKTYQWTALDGGNIVSGANGPNAVVNKPGEYRLVVTSVLTGCTAEATAFVDIDTLRPVANAAIDSIDCPRQQIVLSGANSSSGSTYAWTTANGHIVSGKDSVLAVVDTTGAYFLVVTNPINHCTASDTVQVSTESLLPMATLQPAGVFGCLADTLSLSATVTPANALVAWTASGGGAMVGRTDTTILSVAGPGVYLLTVTNPISGCTAIYRDTVQQDATTPVALIQPVGSLTCFQSSLMLLGDSSSVGPNITYAWTASNGGNIVSGVATAAPLVNAPGVYTLKVTNLDNGCTALASTEVKADTTAVIAIANAPNALTCVVKQVALDATGSNPAYLYQWSTLDGNIVNGAGTPSPLVDAAGTYRLVLTNPANGCTGTDLAEVLLDVAAPPIGILSPATLTCARTTLEIGGQVAGVPGGFTFLWTASNGGHILQNGNTLTPTVDVAGTYALLATDLENGCTASASIDVTADYTPPGATVSVAGLLNCYNMGVQLTAASTANPAVLDHTWTIPNGTTVHTGSSPVLSSSQVGAYLLVVTNNENGCTSTATAAVEAQAPVQLSVDLQQNARCFGSATGAAGVLAEGGNGIYTYLWSNGDAGASVSGLAAGKYTVTVSDGDLCTATAKVNINQPTQLEATASSTPPSNSSSADGTATVLASGGTPGYNYLWSTGGTGNPITGLVSGFYTVTVTDANGCTAVEHVEVGDGACNLQSTTSTIHPSCHGSANGQATVTIANGADPLVYLWSSGSTSQTATSLAAGTYTFTVTDANGCDITGSVELTEPAALTLALTNVTGTSCANAPEGAATVQAGGGTGATAVTWSDGQTGATATGLVAGTYTATVTDANGCTAVVQATVPSSDTEAPVIAAANTTVPLGPSGSVELTLSNLGILITDNCALSGFSLTPATFDCEELGSHTINITAVDSTGNTSSATITVTIIDNLAPVIECPASLVRCAEASTVEYLAPVATDNCLGLGGQFNLTSGLPSGSEFPQGTTTNTYTFTDASGNVGSCSFDVTILSPLTVALDTIVDDIGNQKIGGVNVTVGGSQPGYIYTWILGGQPVATTEDLAGVGMGLYTLVVTDANGCTSLAGPYEVSNVSGTNTPAWMDRVGVFPNPTAGTLYVVLPDDLTDREVQVSVLDLTGRRVLDRLFSRQKQLTVDLSAFAEGMYTVAVRIEEQVGVWKVVRTR